MTKNALLTLAATVALATSATHGFTLADNAEPYQIRNLATIRSIYNLTVYPNNLAFLRDGIAAVPANVFADNVVGRVTPIGDFIGLEDTLEYFFALTPTPAPPTYVSWTKIEVNHFISDCPSVAASVMYGYTTGVNPAVPSTYQETVTILKQVSFWHFNSDGAVDAFDAWLPALQQWWDKAYDTVNYPVSHEPVIAQLCAETMELCSAHPQWTSVDQCMAVLSNKPMSTFDNAWGDNLWCRALHLRLAPLRPQAHCDKVGPTGGGKCVDGNYNDHFFDDQKLFGSTDKFDCPDTAAVVSHSEESTADAAASS